MSLCDMIERGCSVGDLAVKLVLMKCEDEGSTYYPYYGPANEPIVLEFTRYDTVTRDNTCEK